MFKITKFTLSDRIYPIKCAYIRIEDIKYKKILLLRCIHHFKSDLINNMDRIRISGT